MAPPPFFGANETKRPEKIFLSLRVFWARQHRRRLAARTVPSGRRGCSVELLCLLLLCFGRFVSLFFVAVAFGFALALLFDCFALSLLLGACSLAWLTSWPAGRGG
jgi:hypothetical protein